jgi:hypothetical protein
VVREEIVYRVDIDARGIVVELDACMEYPAHRIDLCSRTTRARG